MDAATTSDDAFLGGRLHVLQPLNGYRAGLDAVLLASAVTIAGGGGRVLDAGAGVGVVGLAIASRLAGARVTLVEIDAAMAALASANAGRNGLAGRVEVVVADLRRGGGLLHDAARPDGLDPGSFTHLVANPPYYHTREGTAPAGRQRAVAHQMDDDSLGRWVAFLATAAANGALLALIHRADALPAILAALEGRFGGIMVLPVHSKAGAPANRVLVGARRGSRAPLTLLPGLVLQDADGRYLPAVEAVLRDGAALPPEIWPMA